MTSKQKCSILFVLSVYLNCFVSGAIVYGQQVGHIEATGLTNAPSELAGWPISIAGASRSSRVIVSDLNDDGKDEVILGTYNNMVQVIDETGQNVPGWSVEVYIPERHMVTQISVGDIDGDGDKEIVGMLEKSAGIPHCSVYAWHYESRELVPGWPLDFGRVREVDLVLGYFDDDPLDLEIAIAAVDDYSSIDIYVLNKDGSAVNGWPRHFDIDEISQVRLSAGNIDDEDGDELVVACHKRLYYESPIYVIHGNGQLASGWPVKGNGPFVSRAVLCNLDGGEDIEVVAATVNENHTGRIYAWKHNGTRVIGG